MASRRGELLRLISKLEKLGLDCQQSKRNSHWKVYEGTRMITSISGSPSDHHTWKNTLQDLKRAGVKLPG